MGFAILRTQKLKALASVRRSLKHSFREQDTPNADSSRAAENTHIGAGSTYEAMAALEERLPEKRRKDAVLAVEYLITGSPEDMQAKSREQQDAYFSDSLEWLKKRHGAENVVYAGIHRDETTPHMYAYVVPLDPSSGRLNCKRWLGGAKALSQMQTDFADEVGQRHGLERGIEGSKARHQKVSQHYAAVNREMVAGGTVEASAVEPRVLKKGLFSKLVETPEQVAARITEGIKEGFAPTIAKANESEKNRRRAQEMAATAKAKGEALDKERHRVKLLQRPWQGLTKDDMRGLVEQAEKIRKQREEERKHAEQRAALEKARLAHEERQRRAEEQTARKLGIRQPHKAPESDEQQKDGKSHSPAPKRRTQRSRGGIGR